MRITTHLFGGIGNQLFQLAAGLTTARLLHGADTVRTISSARSARAGIRIFGDALSDYVPDDSRRWKLFAQGLSALPMRELPGVRRSPRDFAVATVGLQRVAPAAYAGRSTPAIGELQEHPLLLDGYFQHPDWFTLSVESLASRIAESNDLPPSSDDEGWQDRAAVFVRRGDYLPLGWCLDDGYYRQAIEEVIRLGVGRLEVISADVDGMEMIDRLARSISRDVEITGAMRSVRGDFVAGARCRVVIMANSTFCWWSTAVGDLSHRGSGGRVVLVPDCWMPDVVTELKRPQWVAVPSFGRGATGG